MGSRRLVLTWSQDSGVVLEILIDGVLDSQQTLSIPALSTKAWKNKQPFNVGCFSDYPGFDGDVSDIQFYVEKLSPQRIKRIIDVSGSGSADFFVQDDMRWTLDFQAALDAGMAIKLPLSEVASRLASGDVVLDTLLVFGVQESFSPQEAEGELTDLLEAHFHTDGLGFVRQQTPTNNTEDAPSGYDPRSPEQIRAMMVSGDTLLATFWRLNQLRVPVAADTGRGRAGILTNGASWFETPFGTRAVRFPGGMGSVVIEMTDKIWRCSNQAFTLAFRLFLRPRIDQNRCLIINKGSEPDLSDALSLWRSADDRIAWECRLGDVLWVASSQQRLPVNTWIHVAFVFIWSSRKGTLKIYIDGVLDLQQSISIPATSTKAWRKQPLHIGSFADHPGFDGDISELQFFVEELSEQKINQLAARAESNARIFAKALGLSVTTEASDALHQVRKGVATNSPRALARAWDAGLPEQADAGNMQTALWATTWGYFLRQMLSGSLSEQDIAYGREHFIKYVRASGPFPAVRIENQPYGILPVMALDRWSPVGSAADLSMIEFVKRLRDTVWLPSLKGIPRVDSTSGDPLEKLMRVLGMHAVSPEIYARMLLGFEYISYLWRFLDREHMRLSDDWRENKYGDPRRVLEMLKLDWDPRAARSVFANYSALLQGPLIEAPHPGSKAQDYLLWLANNRAWKALFDRAEFDDTAARSPLLYLLARQSLLIEFGVAACRFLASDGLLPAGVDLEPELIDMVEDVFAAAPTPVATWTIPRQFERVVAWPGGGFGSLGDYFRQVDWNAEPALADLGSCLSALKYLASRPPEILDRLLRGTLDLASHRLDAWITSFASKQLDALRARQPRGIHVGGYGWLFDFRPRNFSPVPVTSPPPGEDDPGGSPLVMAPGNAGYIHAPSMAQAAAAAVLRSGWRAYTSRNGNAQSDQIGAQLSVDLSSRRVRLANWLLDGVRKGQPLGVLLGYRFERQLHEYPEKILDQYIPSFRKQAPVQGAPLKVGGEPTETISTNVVDGLILHQKWKSNDIDWQDVRDNGDRSAIEGVFASLDDAVDAVGDALLCESVHHAVQGNPMRAGAVLDAAAWGEVQPPELEFVRTPRTGVALTHRLLLCSNVSKAPGPTTTDLTGWPTAPWQARAAAEPTLNSIVAGLLPAPGRVSCRVNWRSDSDAESFGAEFTLDVLQCSALDYVYMASDLSENVQVSELYQRLLAAAYGHRPAETETASPHLEFGRDPSWHQDTLSVNEFLELIRAARELCVSARALSEVDLAPPGVVAEIQDNDAPLQALGIITLAERAKVAIGFLRAIRDNLSAADEERRREGLMAAAAIGILGAFPSIGNLASQAATVLSAVNERLTSFEHRCSAFGDRTKASPAERRSHDVACLQDVFGSAFRVLPPLLRADTGGDLPASLAASASLQGDDRLAAATWLQRVSRVRAGAARLQTVRTYAEAVSGSVDPLAVAQLPYSIGDLWLGMKGIDAGSTGSRLCLVIHGQKLDLARPLAGLFVDGFDEVIPNKTEVTGIAFHFDAPNAQAPQAVLLGVSPDSAPLWTLDTLQATLTEAIDLLKIRAVDPDQLCDLGQFLPALYFAVNKNNDTAWTDFTKAMQG